MKRIYLVIAFLFSTLFAYSQSFYVLASGSSIKKITIDASGKVNSVDLKLCSGLILSAIAVYKNTLYASAGNNLTYGTISGTSVINCGRVASPVPGGDSLTADSTGVLYLNLNTPSTLCTFDPKTQAYKSLGTVPYVFAGDMIFYKGNLYMASTKGIVKLDVNTPANSTLVIPSTLVIYGLAAVAYSSTQNKIYATAVNNIAQTTDIIEVDLDNNKLLNTVTTLPYVVLDAASDVEDGEIPKIVIDSIRQITSCPARAVGLQVICNNPLADYQYILNNTTTNTTGTFQVTPGTYDIKVKSATQIKDTTIIVADPAGTKPITAVAKIDAACDQPGRISFSVSNAGQYTLQDSLGTYPTTHVFSGLLGGTYHFYLLNQRGCYVDTFAVIINNVKCYPVVFPNTFTPNKDGINDMFMPMQGGIATRFKLSVYNRYGLLMFSSANMSSGWDGTYKGNAAPVGTYYWVSTYYDQSDIYRTQSGSVALIR